MNIEIEILEYNYWEHFKHAKDLGLILPLGHPKRVAIENELNRIREYIVNNPIKWFLGRNNPDN